MTELFFFLVLDSKFESEKTGQKTVILEFPFNYLSLNLKKK